MANNKNDKTLKKNWVEGDTFAIKIDRPKSKYNGRYLILIKHVYGFELTRNYVMFRVKLTKGKKIPTTKEEIEKLEYIKTYVEPKEARFLPVKSGKTLQQAFEEDKKNTYQFDEYGFLNCYNANFYIKPGFSCDEFKYIGNFDITPPEDEWIDENSFWIYFLDKTDEKNYVNKLLKNYEDNNLRKSQKYTEEGCKKSHENYKRMVEIGYFGLNYLEKIYGNEDDEE